MERVFLSIEEASNYLGLKKSFLYRTVEQGEIPHYRFGRLIRFKLDDVESWLEGHRMNPVDLGQRAKKILTPALPKINVDRLVRKTIDDVKKTC